MQAQLPLHSGRLLGTPGRVLMSLMGLAVAALSVTGLVIWVRKRRARRVNQLRGTFNARWQ
ncbi:PepSY-associated TM helix domain-containing protein [Achromobacter insolitus]